MSSHDPVLVLGSAPDVLRAREWELDPGVRIVAINNAWRVRPDWLVSIHPKDFPLERRPERLGPEQRRVGHQLYVPAVNRFGGMVYCGGTMAFTAGYWALHALRPRVMAFLGCDMIYASGGPTHFYGHGTPDPLRPDPTLQSLEAKSARLAILAAEAGCTVVNLSDLLSTRLAFRRADRSVLAPGSKLAGPGFDPRAVARAREAEAALGYVVPSGKYWRCFDQIDPAALAHVDALWLDAFHHLRAAAA